MYDHERFDRVHRIIESDNQQISFKKIYIFKTKSQDQDHARMQNTRTWVWNVGEVIYAYLWTKTFNLMFYFITFFILEYYLVYGSSWRLHALLHQHTSISCQFTVLNSQFEAISRQAIVILTQRSVNFDNIRIMVREDLPTETWAYTVMYLIFDLHIRFRIDFLLYFVCPV